MRLALLVVVLLAGTARAQLRGFDHTLHEGQAVVGGAAPPECAACHTLGARAKPVLPTHAACFSAGCHAASKVVSADNARVCGSCHAPAVGKKLGAASWASGADSRDFNLRFAHDRHDAPVRAGRGCLTCHATPDTAAAKKISPIHSRCAGCHQAGQAVAMNDCQACHQAVVGRARAPEQLASPYSVRGRFQHDKHLARVKGGEADTCLLCHAEVARTASDQLPAPSMRTCESCHDGKQAFAALVGCRSCHAQGEALPSEMPMRRFDHRQHRASGNCADCHTLAASGEPRPIGHVACNDAACHADDFRARQAKICGGCHVGSEPWRPLAVDVGRPTHTELGVEFSHAAHAPRDPRACATCHRADAAVAMRITSGHSGCTGATCHAIDESPAQPALGDCQACHQLGLLPARDLRRTSSRWSVAGKFLHAKHRNDGQGGELACQACHTAVAASTRIADLPPPGKPTCLPCHDGKQAFKMTGHGCNRCHTQAARTP